MITKISAFLCVEKKAKQKGSNEDLLEASPDLFTHHLLTQKGPFVVSQNDDPYIYV